MEADPGNKLRKEPGTNKVGFHITLVKSKNENSRGNLRARYIAGYLFTIKRHLMVYI